MTVSRLPRNAFHTDAHHASMASSRFAPGVARMTSAAVIVPRPCGRDHVGHGLPSRHCHMGEPHFTSRAASRHLETILDHTEGA
jgi:hypothetical protein